MQSCSFPNCHRQPQYSYTLQQYYPQCPYHGLTHPKCLMDDCNNLTEYSIMKKKFYHFCPKHGDTKQPKCMVHKCSHLTEFSPTMGIFHSKCSKHGLKNKPQMNDKYIKVDDDIKQNLLFIWITRPYKSLTTKQANTIQPMWENFIMAKNGWLSFWFELDDIANANKVNVDVIIKHLHKSKINLMHTELVRDPKAIRFANNNCDMLYDSKMSQWLHKYLNTYEIQY